MPMRRVAAILSLSVAAAALATAAKAESYDPSLFRELRWRMIGPHRGGRTKAAAGIPDRPNVFYVGAVNGGVWKTDDYGRTWRPIFDDQPTGSVGAIAIAPSNPSVIYVGSGEGLQRPDLSTGDGIYKSTAGGRTWRHLGLREGRQIPQIVVDPSDPNRLFVAVLGSPYGPGPERGLFRSTDGGETFQKVLYRDEDTGAVDIVLDPKDPRTVYAVLWQSRQAPWEYGVFNGPGGDDYHRIWINPRHPDVMLIASDQGVIVTVNGGQSWSSWYNQPTAQLYHVSTDNAFPYRVCGGQQESGSVCITSRGDDGEITFRDWHPVAVEEYGYVAPDPLDPDIVYGGRLTRYDRRTGQAQNVTPRALRSASFRVLRTAPVLFSQIGRASCRE